MHNYHISDTWFARVYHIMRQAILLLCIQLALCQHTKLDDMVDSLSNSVKQMNQKSREQDVEPIIKLSASLSDSETSSQKEIKQMIWRTAPKIFSEYLRAYNIEYGKSEKIKRFKIFLRSLREIVGGEENVSWSKGVNIFTDKTAEEKMAYLGYNRTRSTQDSESQVSPTDPDIGISENIKSKSFGWPYYPDSTTVDWRTRGAMTEPLEQKKCGVCWAFSAVSVLESLYYIRTGVLRSMSIQQAVDCTYISGGCQGGWFPDVWAYVRDANRLAAATSYQLHLNPQSECGHATIASSGDTMLVGFLSSPEAALDEASVISTVSQHPVSAGMHAPDSLFLYKSGIYNPQDCPSSSETNNHAVVIAGYTPFVFIIKNSWGTQWGETGYFQLARGPTCGILTDVQWPKLYIFREKDPDSKDFECEDKYSWCPTFASKSCSKSRWFRDICPYSCSVCSCRDVAHTCSAEVCEESAANWLCRRTCGVCFCPPGTTLCRTRCLPYWHRNFKPRFCDVPLGSLHDYEEQD